MVLLPPAAVVFCVTAGWTWWASMVERFGSPLREPWVLAALTFTAVASVFCGVAGADEPSASVGLLSGLVGFAGGVPIASSECLVLRPAETPEDRPRRAVLLQRPSVSGGGRLRAT
ncbi:hypothetical protein [Streptomyces barringtoniae]|uniref:hypothetical protein n=1 Tax=Streptomyces barringtoniae TaxID=2892029 RepID=UPI001E456C3D|nr:hypothetical protein [Streptomyces barringtoniae]MCC5480980.1 hypothetical protein [Streptomyces barringtoniae]